MFFFSLDDLRTNNFARKKKFQLLILGLILVSGLRWRTGADWKPYSYYFDNFDWSIPFFRIAYESGYVLLTLIVKFFTDSYSVFLTLLAALILIPRSIFVYKYTRSIFFALLLYYGFYMADIVATRQAASISLCMLAIPYIERKKFLYFCVVVALSMTMHISAVFFFFAYFIYHKNWSIKTKILLLLLSIIFGFTPFMQVILEFLASFGGRIAEKANAYGGLNGMERYNDSVSESEKTTAIISGLLKRVIILPLLLYIEYRYRNFNWIIRYRKFMNLFVFGNIAYFIVMRDIALQRFAAYFYMFEVILICMFIDNLPKSKRLQWIIIFSLYALAKLIFIIASAYDYIIPYYWIFDTNFYREPGLNF